MNAVGVRRCTRLLLVLITALVTACDYTVPLVTKPSQALDHALVGQWGCTNDDGNAESLLVLPLGPQELLVSYPAGTPNAMFARGWGWVGSGLSLIQLDWFGTAAGSTPDDAKTFQYASYAMEGDVLRVRLLNTDVIPASITNSADLAEALARNRSHAELFGAPLEFTRISD